MTGSAGPAAGSVEGAAGAAAAGMAGLDVAVAEVPDEDGLAALARTLAVEIGPGSVVLLRGALGAGKTTLARHLCESLGIHDQVTSPSFALVNLYAGAPFPVAHFDLYRLDSGADLESIGAEEYLDGAYAVLVEWPERAGGFLPPPQLELDIEFGEEPHARRVRIARHPRR